MSEELARYKAFIDALVAMKESIGARRLRTNWRASLRTPDEMAREQRRDTSGATEAIQQGFQRYNAFVESLTPEQREFVADLLQHERESGIHGVLVALTDGGYQLSQNGVQLATEPFGTESYFDFVARATGDAWPDER
ncbi:MAG TPA: DUF6547 family protein [Ktedonobacterales bacterium]|nr:DUF6547 family protein [Ktedonobacterales bacterium]